MQKGFKEITLEELKENTLNNNTLNLDLKEVLGIALCDNKDYIYKVIERNKTAENKIDSRPKSEAILSPQLSKEEYDEKFFKAFSILIDEVVEEDTVIDKEPYKETEGKLYYELSWEFIEEMAKRMQYHKNGKYELYNWKNKPMTPKGIDDMKQAINRHHIEVMKGNYDDGEEFLGHIVSYACNAMILWEQLKVK